jgi:hypothetical protein
VTTAPARPEVVVGFTATVGAGLLVFVSVHEDKPIINENRTTGMPPRKMNLDNLDFMKWDLEFLSAQK